MEDAGRRDLLECGILAQELQGLLRVGAVQLRAKIGKNLVLPHTQYTEKFCLSSIALPLTYVKSIRYESLLPASAAR